MSSIPRINSDHILNIIEQQDGCLIIPSLVRNNEQIQINASAYEMLKIIDGKMTLEQICQKLLSFYVGAKYEELYDDVLHFYMSLWHLGIISWDINPCLDEYRKVIGDYSVELTSVDTLETFMHLVSSNDQEYVTPFRYREQMVRRIDIEQAIVNNTTYQFVIKNGNGAILSTIIRIDLREIAYIIDYMACDKSFFVIPDEILCNIIKWMREKINTFVQRYISKNINIYSWEISVLKEDRVWQDYFLQRNYTQKIDLTKETIDGDITSFYFICKKEV